MTRSHTITLLQMNDTHGYLEPHQEIFWDGDRAEYKLVGGYARISALFRQIRRERDGAVIALDNGDTLHGTYPAVHSRGAAFIAPLNHLQLDAWTVHWDFAYGAERLRELAGRLTYPLLASNCYRKDTNQLVYPPYTVIERAGLRIGVIGIAATIIDKTMPAHFSEGLYFTLGNAELPGHIRTLRDQEKVDLVVVLSHLGFPQDMKLATEVPGIDVLLSGHTHNRMVEPVCVNGAILMQSGCHGSFIGRLDVSITDGKMTGTTHRLLCVDESLTPDPDMQALIENVMAPLRPLLTETIGQTEIALNRNTMLEATMDNLLLHAIVAAAATPIAFSMDGAMARPSRKG